MGGGGQQDRRQGPMQKGVRGHFSCVYRGHFWRKRRPRALSKVPARNLTRALFRKGAREHFSGREPGPTGTRGHFPDAGTSARCPPDGRPRALSRFWQGGAGPKIGGHPRALFERPKKRVGVEPGRPLTLLVKVPACAHLQW